MRRPLLALSLIGLGGSALAIDHNNIDSGRPLRFDDAYSIAYRERAMEFGLSLDTFRRKAASYGFQAEYKFGFAKNQDIGIAFHPSYEGSEKRFDVGDVELSYFHGIRREIDNAPALAYRVDVGLPTGRDSRGLDVRLRGIATKALGQYDKLHLNLDLGLAVDAHEDERNVTFGAILGYSTPLGYPKRFDQTLVAELALQQSALKGEGYTGTVGVGLRKQVGVRSVFDIGLESDLFSTKGASKSPLRLAIGYSIGF